MKEFEKKNVTADSLGNVILIKPNTNNEKFSNDFIIPRMNVKEEVKLDYNFNKLKINTQINNLNITLKEDKSVVKKKEDIKKALNSNLKNNNESKPLVIFIENKVEEEKPNKYTLPLKENKVIVQPAGSNFE